jgi:phosphatidylglycerol:prolipoprotein diacylglycerol transferase
VRQILLQIPIPGTDRVLTLYGYGLAMCLGFLAAILLAAWRAKRQNQPPEVIHNASLAAFFGGVLGARAFFVVQYSGQFPSLWDLVRIWEGGLTFYGGFIVATIAVIVYLRASRRPVLYWLDIIAPSVALGLAFGRLGCLLNGCCYGDVCHHGWGMVWPAGSIPWQHYADAYAASLGIGPDPGGGAVAGAVTGALAAGWQPPAIHLTQIYSMVNALLLALVLHTMWRWKRRHGQIILAFAVLYGLTRFLLEMLRADEAAAYLLGLPTVLRGLGLAEAAQRLPGMTISQNVAIAMVAGGVLGLVWLARSPRRELQADYVPPAVPEATGGRGGKRRKERHA